MGNERIRQIGQVAGLKVFDLGSARALAVANFPLSFQRSDRLV